MPFMVLYDASSVVVRVVLMQKGWLIVYESRKLTPIERTFSIYEKEMLAIMHVLEKFK